MYKCILTSSFWLLIGNSFGRLSLFLANFFAARVLEQNAFGQYAMIRSTISMIEAVIDASIGNSVVKKVSENIENGRQKIVSLILAAFFLNFIFIVFFSIAIILFSDEFVALFFLDEKNLVSGFNYGIFLLAAVLLSSVAQKIVIGLEGYKLLAKAAVILSFVSIPFIYKLIHDYKLVGAILGVAMFLFADAVVKCFVIYRQLKKSKIAFNVKGISESVRAIITTSSLLVFSAVISAFSLWYIRVLIVGKSNGFDDIAMFNAAYQWLTIVMIVTGATASVSLQVFSKETQDTIKILRASLAINVFIALSFSLLFSFFAKELMQLYGDNYLDGYILIYVLSFVVVLSTISSVLNKLFIAIDRQKVILLHNIFASTIAVLFVLCFTLSNLSLQLAFSLCLYFLILVFFGLLLLYRIDSDFIR